MGRGTAPRETRRTRRPTAPAPHSLQWYQDAVIYQLHVKTFFDANGDGVGDFEGLVQKLEYVRRLGATCVWLLPFFESPLLDDGYDVAHYERIQPAYGTFEDVRRFIDTAHAMDLRVIAELVVNHTSDQHPWFQASRRAKEGTPKRNFYVWSPDPGKYADARIIFGDSETSNWTWDEVAGAYYWHRFYYHQPDLNFDNPQVRRAVWRVMRFWFDLGVDGLRLDAVAHLFERDGTACDNLPETHAYLKEVRAALDLKYPGRVLLAEVNQPPEATRGYFGTGDECHMAFHFPLMPRIFQALGLARAAPVLDVLEQTMDIPLTCQWALFLRNHDELTLSALSAADREALLELYAPSPFMRLHLGIRRRLAPLLGNDRRLIELAHVLLFSLPGTPVIYYGDEIGMGDDLALPDRDGVRTPMQWSAEPHAGFAPPSATLGVAAPIGEAPYGFQTLNVAAQEADPHSLLAQMRHLVHVRQANPVFGRGRTELLRNVHPSVLAFVRSDFTERVLVLANLSPRPHQLPLPVAIAGQRGYDLVAQRPLLVSHPEEAWTLAPYGYVWWRLDE